MDISHSEATRKSTAIISSRVETFEDFAAVYILSERDGLFCLGVISLAPSGEALDKAFISDLCHSEREARNLFNTVADGRVTPCALTDVIEDLICI